MLPWSKDLKLNIVIYTNKYLKDKLNIEVAYLQIKTLLTCTFFLAHISEVEQKLYTFQNIHPSFHPPILAPHPRTHSQNTVVGAVHFSPRPSVISCLFHLEILHLIIPIKYITA